MSNFAMPSARPSGMPSAVPSGMPSVMPSGLPSLFPSPPGGAWVEMPAEGPLGRVLALNLLSRLSMAHADGHLLLENEGGQLGFVFGQGNLEATHSTWLEDTPERWLLAEDLLSPMELGLPGFETAQWLARQLTLGEVDKARLWRCMERSAEQTLARAMRWSCGRYAWKDRLPEVRMRLPAKDNGRLFLSAARALPGGFFMQHLGALWSLPWKLGPHALEAETLPWQAEELEAVHRLRSCERPAQAAPHESQTALYARVAFVLWQTEMWMPSPSPPGDRVLETRSEKPACPALEEAEVEAQWGAKLKAMQKAWEGKDAFSLLGLKPGAQATEAKRAYFSLVRQLHPDTLPPGVSESTQKVAADLFAQLGEAYRCLSDEEERAHLLQKLSGGNEEVVAQAQAPQAGLEALLDAESLFKKAARMVDSRRFAEALPLLQEALKRNPAEAEYWAYLGYAKHFTPGYGAQAALADLEKAKQQNPAFPDTYYFLGRLAKLRKETTLAKTLFEQCLSLEPGHMQAQQELRLLP